MGNRYIILEQPVAKINESKNLVSIFAINEIKLFIDDETAEYIRRNMTWRGSEIIKEDNYYRTSILTRLGENLRKILGMCVAFDIDVHVGDNFLNVDRMVDTYRNVYLCEDGLLAKELNNVQYEKMNIALSALTIFMGDIVGYDIVGGLYLENISYDIYKNVINEDIEVRINTKYQ